MHADSARSIGRELDLPGVHAGPDRQPDRLNALTKQLDADAKAAAGADAARLKALSATVKSEAGTLK